MAEQVTANFPDRVFGTTFKTVTYTMTDENGDPINLSGWLIEIAFKKQANADAAKFLSSATGGITITDAANGIWQINAFTIDMSPALYLYDIKTTDSFNVVEDYVRGSFKVLQNIT
jgi:hypothetical protein